MSDQQAETRLCELLITELFGTIVVLGPDRGELLPALAAAASEVLLVEDGESEEVAGELVDLGAEVTVVEGAAIEEIEPASGLVLARLPEEKPEETIDRLLGAVADEGFVLCDLPPMPRSLRLRLDRLIRSMLVDVRMIEEAAETGALVLAGRRKARGVDFLCELDRDPLPLTVFVYGEKAGPALNLLVLDLLFRQSVPPAVVIVLDDAKAAEDRVPDDLWGLAGHSISQPAIIRCEGRGRIAALREGLSQLDTEYAAFLEAGQRPAPLWAERLCDLLTAEEGVEVAIGGAIERRVEGDLLEHAIGTGAGAGNLLAILLAGEPPAAGAMIFRDGPQLDLGAAPAELEDAAPLLMMLRAAQAGDVGNMPLPLLVFEAATSTPTARRVALEVFADEVNIERVEAGLSMVPEEDRAGLARHVLAGALHEASALGPAIDFYRRALAIEPGLVELRCDLLRALRESGQAEAFRTEAEAACAASPDEPALRLALAAAKSDLGDFEALEELLRSAEGDEPALLWSAAALAARRLGDQALGGHLAALRDRLLAEDGFGDLEELLVRLDGSGGSER